MTISLEQSMVEEFQCPGCMAGMDTNCGSYEPEAASNQCGCKSHIAGTLVSGIGSIYLGLPKGFNRHGPVDKTMQRSLVRLFPEFPVDWYDKFNVPVWAMERDGHLFVRCYSPRINQTFIDVIRGGTLADFGSRTVVNVGEFIDEID